jgi:hypothetical protein
VQGSWKKADKELIKVEYAWGRGGYTPDNHIRLLNQPRDFFVISNINNPILDIQMLLHELLQFMQ